jgi:hypothetical protein
VLKTLGIAGGACALLAGAAVAGTAANATPGAPVAAAPAAQTRLADADTGELALDAAGDGTATDGGRRQALCARVPKAVVRTQALEKRLAADASTKGSLAWLRTRIDEAKASNRDQVVTVLQNRLEYRTALAQFLPQRLALLQKAQTTVCAPGAKGPASS